MKNASAFPRRNHWRLLRGVWGQTAGARARTWVQGVRRHLRPHALAHIDPASSKLPVAAWGTAHPAAFLHCSSAACGSAPQPAGSRNFMGRTLFSDIKVPFACLSCAAAPQAGSGHMGPARAPLGPGLGERGLSRDSDAWHRKKCSCAQAECSETGVPGQVSADVNENISLANRRDGSLVVHAPWINRKHARMSRHKLQEKLLHNKFLPGLRGKQRLTAFGFNRCG